MSPGPGACRTQPLAPAVGLGQRSPTFEGPGTGFVEDNFSMDWGGDGFVIIIIFTSAPPQVIRH